MSHTWDIVLASFSVGVASATIALWILLVSRRSEFLTARSFDGWIRRTQTVSLLVGVLSGCILGGAIATMAVAPPLHVLRLLSIAAGFAILSAGFGVLHRARSAPFQRRLASAHAPGWGSPSRAAILAIGAWVVTIVYIVVQTIIEWSGASEAR